MAGRGYGVTAALCFWMGAAAAEPATPTPAPAPGFPEFETMRRNYEALTPEQKQKFRENFQRWMSLPPDEKKLLREREEVRRVRVNEEIEKALKDSGLTLTSEQREQYARRYSDERRQIEQKLQEQRRPMVQSLIARLKEEFSGGPAPK